MHSPVNAIENSLAHSFLHTKELIVLLHFHPDLLLGLQRPGLEVITKSDGR
jgi:hypothetical protein